MAHLKPGQEIYVGRMVRAFENEDRDADPPPGWYIVKALDGPFVSFEGVDFTVYADAVYHIDDDTERAKAKEVTKKKGVTQ